jgi:hypothetical protein
MVAGDPDRCRVRVWFGPHVIAVYAADQALATAYLDVMRGHFAGLQFTIDEDLTGAERPLPAARLWDAVAP